ncbi:hypothetical protein B0H13DRAFT_2655495 [Mycena leptocephala]|nr:hypothetical protein B0H13DRAFT_2655495 [Mycena leptocephala]
MEDLGVFCNRKDLADELRRLAFEKDGQGGPEIFGLEKLLRAILDQSKLTLEDGEVIHADLILGRDGIGSIVRSSILGYILKAPSSGGPASALYLTRQRWTAFQNWCG